MTLALAIGAAPATAAPGDLDPAFSRDGKVMGGFPGMQVTGPSDLAIRPDGRLVVATTVQRKPPKKHNDRPVVRRHLASKAHDIAVARLTAKGRLDRSFSGDGRTVVRIPGDQRSADVGVLSDGRIVIAASAQNDMLVVRLDKRGRLDRSFSADGQATADFGLEDYAAALELQADGTVFVAGTARRAPTSESDSFDNDFAIAWFTASGALDPAFSADGLTTIDFTPSGSPTTFSDDSANGLAVAADGRIVLAGNATRLSDPYDEYSDRRVFATAALLPNGSPDPSFGAQSDGRAVTDFGTDAYALAVALSRDGSIFAGGSTFENFALARYTGLGLADPSFAGDGTALVDAGSDDETANALAIQDDRELVIAGTTEGLRRSDDFALVRLTAGGVADASFSGDGKLTVDFGSRDNASAVGLQADAKIVVSGTSAGKIALSRHLVAPGPADFDADGFADAVDGCPDQFGVKPRGCPKRDHGGGHGDG